MENAKLEVRIHDKSLDVNGKKLNLDESFFYAGVSKIPDQGNEIALELKYQNKEGDFVYKEGGRIHEFLEQEKLAGRIQTHFVPDQGSDQTIALTGDYEVAVYR